MDKDLALLIQTTCNHSTREIADQVPMLKLHAEPEDYEHLKLEIGRAVYDVMSNIMGYVEARCPEIKADMERRMERYQRAF